MEIPTFIDVEKAHQKIQKYAHRTLVLTSKSINETWFFMYEGKC